MGSHTERPTGKAPQEDHRRQCGGDFSDRMLEAMQTSLIFFDSDGTMRRANTLARNDLRIHGELGGMKITDLISIIHNERNILPELIAGLADGSADQVKLPAGSLVRRNDRKTQFYASGCLLSVERGCCLFSFRNIMDEITREQILSMVLARTKIYPWFYDMDADRMLIDIHWFEYLGLPPGDCTLTQKEFFDRVHPDERTMLADALQKQLSNYEIQDTFYYRLLRADGTWEWFSEQSMYLSRTDDGSPYRVVGVCQSIQDHKIIEEDLRTARNKAEESDRLKSAFLANISHEIRTPLNAIVGFSNLFAAGEVGPGSEDALEYSALIDKNSNHLLALVSDILDLSRIETGSMEYSFAENSLGRMLSNVYDSYEGTMPPNVRLRLMLPPTDTAIRTDILRLRQVVDHLIGNALKFTDSGHIDIGYAVVDEGTAVRLFVADTGRGIPQDQLEKIFDRFYKLDTFMQGAGLGLSVCKTVIEGLGGSIEVCSRLGKGSRFTLELPLQTH